MGGAGGIGILRCAQDDGKNKQRQRQKQHNSNGKSNGNGNGKSEIQGSLHCAADDETVRCFGRDDVFLLGA